MEAFKCMRSIWPTKCVHVHVYEQSVIICLSFYICLIMCLEVVTLFVSISLGSTQEEARNTTEAIKPRNASVDADDIRAELVTKGNKSYQKPNTSHSRFGRRAQTKRPPLTAVSADASWRRQLVLFRETPFSIISEMFC